MCELLAMSSLRPAQLSFSLDTLASHGSPAGRARDGWGRGVLSRPLTGEDWRPLARGEVLAITSGKVARADKA